MHSATFGTVQAICRALLGAIALLLVAAPAAMAGPGITFYPKAGPVLQLSGGQISSIANTAARTYTLPPDSERAGQKVTLRGISIGALVARSGQSAQRVQVVKENGGSVGVTPANFATALIADAGATTYYIRSSGGVVIEFIETSDVPLEVSVDGGDLVVKAKANRKKVKVGESVTFEATVSGGKPGVSYSIEWDFGEGPVNGKRVSYSPDVAGVLFAQVEVRDPDPGCTMRCSGTEQVAVDVGEAPEQPEDADRGRRQRHPRRRGLLGRQRRRWERRHRRRQRRGPAPPRAARIPAPTSPAGAGARARAAAPAAQAVRHDDLRRAHQRHRHGRPQAARRQARRRRGGRPRRPRRRDPRRFPLAIGGLLALGVMWVGALRERRAVRLRVA